MIAIQATDKRIKDLQAPCYAFFVEQDFAFSAKLQHFANDFFPDLPLLLKKKEFTGKALQSIVLPFLINKKLAHVIFVGLGKSKTKIDLEQYRRVLGVIYKNVASLKCESVVIQMPAPSLFGTTAEIMGKETATMLHIASYCFDEFISEKDSKETALFDVKLIVDAKNKKAVQDGIKQGEVVAHAVNKARHWIDLPPSLLTPFELTDKAKDVAKKGGLKITIFNEKQINDMGMGGLAAVSRGSENDCNLVILEYKAKKKNAPTIAFVGKGITFDSGGLSIKPAVHMETMKEDMSGAAAVIAAMEAIAALKPAVNVIGITPLAENLPSGKSTKPGDIVRFYNGKTAEIKNTDAEGRLILGDALSYAVKHYKPNAIIDIATLTGACAYALGPFYTGLMSEDDALVKKIEQAAQRSGDRVWRLPMHDDYKKAIRSDVADICNIGSQKYMAGAITAACFLHHFVKDVPFAHLDIAGTAFNVPDMPYFRTGATGVGVRLLVDIAMNWK